MYIYREKKFINHLFQQFLFRVVANYAVRNNNKNNKNKKKTVINELENEEKINFLLPKIVAIICFHILFSLFLFLFLSYTSIEFQSSFWKLITKYLSLYRFFCLLFVLQLSKQSFRLVEFNFYCYICYNIYRF